MRSASSPDGVHWTEDEGNVLDVYWDTQNVALSDRQRKAYVVYVRYARGSRRAVGRTEGATLRGMPHPRIVLEPDCQDPPFVDFYTSAYSCHPISDVPRKATRTKKTVWWRFRRRRKANARSCSPGASARNSGSVTGPSRAAGSGWSSHRKMGSGRAGLGRVAFL